MSDSSKDDIVDRRDHASKGLGFTSWLSDLASGDKDKLGEYADLYFIIRDAKFVPMYDFTRYSETITRMFEEDPAYGRRLIELLLRAEGEWRIDRSAKTDARESLGLDKKTGRDAFAPVKALKCEFKDRGGRICGDHVVPGSPRCEKHGGALIDVETRQSLLMVAYARLIEGSDTAVQALVEIAEGSRSDIARVQAAKEILDRVGLSPELRISFAEGDSSNDRLYRLGQMLEKTRERLTDAAAIERELAAGDDDDDIVEAEIVDETKPMKVEIVR